MADFSNTDETISKGTAKRRFLLVDSDLEGLEFEVKENPLNKGYTPMKIFKLSEVESVAISKWGGKEKLSSEQEKRRHQTVKLDSKREEEKRHFWDTEEFYEPLQRFMEKLDLPPETKSSYFTEKKSQSNLEGDNQDADQITNCDIILCYSDCLHSSPPDFVARNLLKMYPEARRIDKGTPYNDRRKMGHFSWTVSQSKNQIIVNLYVAHKWKAASKSEPSVPVLNFDALGVALKRFSTLLTRTLQKQKRQSHSVKIGTYTPFRADKDLFHRVLEENMEYPVKIYANVTKQSALRHSGAKQN